jgi:hypothetical protein
MHHEIPSKAFLYSKRKHANTWSKKLQEEMRKKERRMGEEWERFGIVIVH